MLGRFNRLQAEATQAVFSRNPRQEVHPVAAELFNGKAVVGQDQARQGHSMLSHSDR